MATARLPEKVLMVDDEANILDSFRRELRGKINLDTALGGEEGLRKLSQNGPYAVVVSDLRMPGMDGIEFLAKVRAAWPDTVRIMLTGYADVQNTISAVNEGHIFRFLTKPCDSVTLVKALAAGIRQYRLVTAEKELLEKTLKGSIAVLTDLLALVKPEAFARASRITQWVMQIVRELGVEQTWEFEAAAMLSQIGYVTLPDQVIKKVCRGQELTSEEAEIFSQHFRLAADLVALK
jgi:response regulator RpfG family c-di-GMP phosphodiesterase